MPKTFSLLLGLVLLFGLSVPAAAWMEQSQSQKMEQSAEVSVSFSQETQVESSSHVTITQTGEQSQTQIINGSHMVRSRTRNGNDAPRYGEVWLNWRKRGGTCHIRYTEAGESWYKYSTVTNCDNRNITIGGLVPGQRYKFQVKKDDEDWTTVTTGVAGR